MISNADGASHHDADFRKMAGDVVGKLQEDAVRYKKGLQKTINQNPMTSLLVAAGLGLVAGAFFNRR